MIGKINAWLANRREEKRKEAIESGYNSAAGKLLEHGDAAIPGLEAMIVAISHPFDLGMFLALGRAAEVGLTGKLEAVTVPEWTVSQNDLNTCEEIGRKLAALFPGDHPTDWPATKGKAAPTAYQQWLKEYDRAES